MAKYDIFISYSRKDTAIADKICDVLDKYGITYFIDRQGIAGGMEFPMVLADAIVDCQLFLFLASNNSYASKFTNSEITFAFNEKSRQSILPYIIDGSELPRHFRFIFSGINWRNISQHPIDTVLIDDLCTLLERKKPVPVTTKKTAATQAQIDEWVQLGDKYFNSEGVSKDYAEAAKWYRLAAEQGYDDAKEALKRLNVK